MKPWLKTAMRQAAWAPATVVAGYAIAAKGFNAYVLVPSLDVPTHFLGGMAITYFFLAVVAHIQEAVGRIPRPVQFVLALGLTAISAIVWEFLEFLSDFALATRMNLGVTDTLSDLFFGLLGGFVMISVAAVIPRICPTFTGERASEA